MECSGKNSMLASIVHAALQRPLKVIVIGSVVHQQRPHDAPILICQRDGSDIAMTPLDKFIEPALTN
jgi:hypothetical protein